VIPYSYFLKQATSFGFVFQLQNRTYILLDVSIIFPKYNKKVKWLKFSFLRDDNVTVTQTIKRNSLLYGIVFIRSKKQYEHQPWLIKWILNN